MLCFHWKLVFWINSSLLLEWWNEKNYTFQNLKKIGKTKNYSSRHKKFKREEKENRKIRKIDYTNYEKNKNFNKFNELEIELVKLKYEDNPQKLANENEELNKIDVYDVNLHEIKYEVLKGYNGIFEMVGNMVVGEIIEKTNVRFTNIFKILKPN